MSPSAHEAMVRAARLPAVTALLFRVVNDDDDDGGGGGGTGTDTDTDTDTDRYIKHIHNLCAHLARLLPNLEQLLLTVNMTSMRALGNCCGGGGGIGTLVHTSAFSVYEPSGQILKIFASLERLYLGNSSIFTSTYRPAPLDRFGDDEMTGGGTGGGGASDCYLFCGCSARFTHVDLRNVDLYSLRNGPIPQSWLMKFVRKTPTPRNFASDLTDSNIAILRKERPDVTFWNEYGAIWSDEGIQRED